MKFVPDTEYFSRLNKEFKAIMKEIRKAERIIIFRHTNPDYDALGTQLGLKTYLKENYPEKEVYAIGDIVNSFVPRIFPYMDEAKPEIFEKPYLAIVVDVADTKRISMMNFKNATGIIKLDHHPEVEEYATISCVHPEMAAAGELVTLMLESMQKSHEYISAEAARFLFIAIVGDSGRFLFSDVSPMTMRLAADLMQCGINKDAIYQEMYFTSVKEFEFKKWALTHYHISKGGTCYYVLKDEDLKELGLEPADGKLQISLFRNVEGIDAVASITEYKDESKFRVSLRSSTKIVSKVAQMYNGGGHDFAAGCELKSLDQLDSLIHELDVLSKVKPGE